MNIRYGRLNATDQEVLEAAAQAEIHERIEEFPDKYDTVVGERGLKLSGGEKQRVAIARTVLKSPLVVLLDEATSSLDSNTEKNILKALNQDVCAGKTTLAIAHRLSTVKHADVILVLDNGSITERGSHDELIELDGLYASMWNSQSGSEGNNADSSDGADANSKPMQDK